MRAVSRDERILEILRTNDYAALDERKHAIVQFSQKLTSRPADTTKGDIGVLRDAGLDDESILHVVQICAYYNFVNRLADGLGVTLET